VKGKKAISFKKFLTINSNLVHVSDTWSDLWAVIFYTGQSVGRLIDLRYTDIERGSAYLRVKGRIKAKRIELSAPVCAILERRRETYPQDVFVFQSHSNRVKNRDSPVTVIAFNAALRKVSKLATGELASSKNARKVIV
jgi:integrase